jgi:hypothetical protein
MLICTVENSRLQFVRGTRHSGWQELWTLETAELLGDSDLDPTSVPKELAKGPVEVLLVPDYWLTTRTYKLQTKKKSVVDAFLTRKLKDELGGMPGAEAFFSYRFFATRARENRIHTIHLQEPAALELYAALQKHALEPRRITSPALLWEARLRQLFPDFDGERSALLHVLRGECFQYFFDRGRFLFSRNLATAPPDQDGTADFTDVIFEATQSQRLYTQKTQTEVNVFYLLASADSQAPDADFFARGLEKRVVDLADEASAPRALCKLRDHGSNEIAREFIRTSKVARLPGVSHSATERELFWHPIQWVGVAAGVGAALCAGISLSYLWPIYVTAQATLPGSGIRSASARGQILVEYEQGLDQILTGAGRPNLVQIATRVASSVPAEMRIRAIKAKSTDSGGMTIAGEVDADRTGELEATLGTFLERLHGELPRAAGLSLSDITVNHVSTDAITSSVDEEAPRFSFKLEVPLT